MTEITVHEGTSLCAAKGLRVGGWLAMALLWLVVSLPIDVLMLVSFGAGELEIESGFASLRYGAILGAATFALVVLNVFALTLFLRRKKRAPTAVMAYGLGALAVSAAAAGAYPEGVGPPGLAQDLQTSFELQTVWTGFWMAYFLMSRRVRQTFVR